jgi:hypothetical protein
MWCFLGVVLIIIVLVDLHLLWIPVIFGGREINFAKIGELMKSANLQNLVANDNRHLVFCVSCNGRHG